MPDQTEETQDKQRVSRVSEQELERRERALAVFKENYQAAATGDEVAWRRVLSAQGRKPTREEIAEFRRADGVPVLTGERMFQLYGLDRPPEWKAKVQRANEAFNAGMNGNLKAWKDAYGLITGGTLTREQVKNYKIIGGPPPLQMERQFQLLGGGDVRPQGHLDRLRQLEENYGLAREGNRDAMRWLEAAFEKAPGSLKPSDLNGPGGELIGSGGLGAGLAPGRSSFLEDLVSGGGDGPGAGPEKDGAPRHRGGGSPRPAKSGETGRDSTTPPESDDTLWDELPEEFFGPELDHNNSETDTPATSKSGGTVGGGGGGTKNGNATEGDEDFAIEYIWPDADGNVRIDSDGDGEEETRNPETWEEVDTTPDKDDGTDDSMPNPMDDGPAVTIDPKKPPIKIIIGGGDPVGPDRDDRPSRNATGPLLGRRGKGDVDPLPDATEHTVAVDSSKPPIKIVIGGGDPVGPDGDGDPTPNPLNPNKPDGPLIEPDGLDPKARGGRRPL